jgi:hypothetical protein
MFRALSDEKNTKLVSRYIEKMEKVFTKPQDGVQYTATHYSRNQWASHLLVNAP